MHKFNRRRFTRFSIASTKLPVMDGAADERPESGDSQNDRGDDQIANECDFRTIASRLPDLRRRVRLPVPLFSPDSAWNQRADGDDVLRDPLSDQRIEVTNLLLIEYSKTVGRDVNLFYVNYNHFTIPIFPTRRSSVRLLTYEGQQWPTHNPPSQKVGGELIVPNVPVPAGLLRPSGPSGTDSDGHLVLYDVDTQSEFDFWQATTQQDIEGTSLGGGLPGTTILESGAVAHFYLNGPGARQTTQDNPLNSARASGIPLLAGLILPEDIEALIPDDLTEKDVSAIGHALVFAFPGLRCHTNSNSNDNSSGWVYPASSTETYKCSQNSLALAAGERIRLRKQLFFADGTPLDEDDPDVARITKIFFQTLRRFGAYLCDGAGGVSFYAEDIHTAHLEISDEQLEWLIAGPRLPGETAWQAVTGKLNEQLSWELGVISGVGEQPLPFTIVNDNGPIGNIEVVAPSKRPIP